MFKIQKEFFDFEKKEKLFELKLCDEYFWQYIRVYVYNDILHYKGIAKHWIPISSVKKSKLNKVNSLFIEFKGALKYYLWSMNKGRIKKYDIIIFINDSKIESIISNYAKILSKNYKLLVLHSGKFANKKIYALPCASKNIRIPQYLARIKARKYIYNNDEIKILQNISAKIQERFGVVIDCLDITKDVFLSQYFLNYCFDNYFKNYQPKLAGVINDGRKISFIKRAHKTNTPVFEIQHGNISSLDLTWNYHKPNKKTKDGIIDYFFTLGDYWEKKQNLPSQIFSVGFPNYEHEKEKFANKKFIKDIKGILAISVMDKSFEAFILASAILLPEFTFYFKLRPDEYDSWKSLYASEFINQSNIVIIHNEKPSLYELFRSVSYQISSNSTVLYEGIAHKLTTFIYKGWRYEDVIDLVDDNQAILVESPEDIKNNLSGDMNMQPTIVPEFIFKNNSSYNIVNSIEKLIKIEAQNCK
jgi:hypothetical protein